MNFYNLVSLINQSIQDLDSHPNQQLTPLIDDLTRAKAELNRLISRRSSEDPVKDFINSRASEIYRQKQYLANDENLGSSPEILQEILRLNLIEDWLLSEINRLENPHPWDTH